MTPEERADALITWTMPDAGRRYVVRAIADAIRAAVEAEREAWAALAGKLISAGGEDGRYVAISEQRAWAEAVAAVRERGQT